MQLTSRSLAKTPVLQFHELHISTTIFAFSEANLFSAKLDFSHRISRTQSGNLNVRSHFLKVGKSDHPVRKKLQ